MLLILSVLFACNPSADGASAGSRPPALVETDLVREGTLSDQWSFLGDVRAMQRAELAAASDGALTKVAVREGALVKRGDLLAEIDSGVAFAELKAARADVQQVTASLERAEQRLKRLRAVGSDVLAAEELDEAQSTVNTLRAQLAGAEAGEQLAVARLERLRIRAPFDGAITRRHADPGDWVGPGTQVLDMVSSDTLEVRVEAPLELTRMVQPGLTARLVGSGETSATVEGVVPALDPVSRTSVIRLTPDVATDWLAPGLPVRVVFPVTRTGGVVVPRDAVVTGPVDETVFKVSEGIATPIVVERIAASETEMLVSGDLTVGDTVVVKGNERLRPGQSVRTGQ